MARNWELPYPQERLPSNWNIGISSMALMPRSSRYGRKPRGAGKGPAARPAGDGGPAGISAVSVVGDVAACLPEDHLDRGRVRGPDDEAQPRRRSRGAIR